MRCPRGARGFRPSPGKDTKQGTRFGRHPPPPGLRRRSAIAAPQTAGHLWARNPRDPKPARASWLGQRSIQDLKIAFVHFSILVRGSVECSTKRPSWQPKGKRSPDAFFGRDASDSVAMAGLGGAVGCFSGNEATAMKTLGLEVTKWLFWGLSFLGCFLITC